MKVLGLLIAAGTVTGGIWAGLDQLGVRPALIREVDTLRQQVAANTTSVQLQRWQYLEEKRKNVGLTPEERLEYCKLSEELGFAGVGCAND